MYNDGQWTEARFSAFTKGLLRAGMQRWGPKHTVKKEAWVSRGVYRCVGHKKRWHHVSVTIKVKGKRVNNVFVDHITPVIDPLVGFESWDATIQRMFCDSDNMQVLCKVCHDKKTKEERDIRKSRRKANG